MVICWERAVPLAVSACVVLYLMSSSWSVLLSRLMSGVGCGIPENCLFIYFAVPLPELKTCFSQKCNAALPEFKVFFFFFFFAFFFLVFVVVVFFSGKEDMLFTEV